MVFLRTASIFLIAVTAELGGAYAVWRWRREGGTGWLALAGIAALFFYAFIQTYQPETSFGRLFAAYAGVFLLGAMAWAWLVDDFQPDTADLIGAALVLAGIAVILWGREIGA